MLKEFVQKIAEMSQVQHWELNNTSYTTKPVYEVEKKRYFRDSLQASTLSAMVEYIMSLRDQDFMKSDGVFLQIDSFCCVTLKTTIDSAFKERERIFRSSFSLNGFDFNNYLPADQFVIGLQTGFVGSDQLDIVKEIAGNLTQESELKVSDDGVTQHTTVKKGVRTMAGVVVPSPVYLKPYVTFPEIDQPERPFIFRIKGIDKEVPQCALIQTMDEQWKLEAISLIKRFLAENIPDIPIIG